MCTINEKYLPTLPTFEFRLKDCETLIAFLQIAFVDLL